jgi:hypothetical protein
MNLTIALAWAVDPLAFSVFFPLHAPLALVELLLLEPDDELLLSLPHADRSSTLTPSTLMAAADRLNFT